MICRDCCWTTGLQPCADEDAAQFSTDHIVKIYYTQMSIQFTIFIGSQLAPRKIPAGLIRRSILPLSFTRLRQRSRWRSN